jgi:cardiolipin-specific phospholipase
MAQTATSPAPVNVFSGTKESMASTSSLPSSLGEILPDWTAPEIPKTIKDSFSAWIKSGDGGASAELHLYRRTGYFAGASLNNAANAGLGTAFQEVSNSKRSSDTATHADLTKRATIGTKVNADGKVGSIRMVDIGNPGPSSWFGPPTPRQINMLEIGTPTDAPDPAEEKVVLLHGYGAGTAFFFQNLAGMAKLPNSRLYALDWLGMGRSSRVPFHIDQHDAKQKETRVAAAESFFVQALEDWRAKIGVEKMTLVAHSLGGYLSIAYTLKYPHRVSRLVLVSPAGIPEGPDEGLATSPKGNGGRGVEAEVEQPQEGNTPFSAAEANKDAQKMKSVPTNDTSDPFQKTKNPPPRMGSKTRTVFSWLWERNTSPFGIVRNSLFFGPLLVGRYTSRRFGTLPDDELRSVHAYCHAIFSSRGSSEYCLAHLLAPGAYARLPMVARITGLPSTLPVSFIYGAVDWMDVEGGRESVKRLARAGNTAGSTFVVPNAGHHVYLDNPRAFDALLSRILKGQADGDGREQ